MLQCSLGTEPTPNYLELEAVATTPVHAGNHCPLPQCLPGTTLRPGACWGRGAILPHSPTLFTLRRSGRGGSPGQPAARGSAGALLLFAHSLLRPCGRHRHYSLHAPQYSADELGPGPSPESRPVGPAAGHAGIWSPPPTLLHESPSKGELPAPQPSARFALALLHRLLGGADASREAGGPHRLSPRAVSMRTSRVEAAGGGAVRANLPLGLIEPLGKLQNPATQASSLAQL